MNPAYDEEFPISLEARTARELAANRRRFARDGVAISSGPTNLGYRAVGDGGSAFSVRPAARALCHGTAFDHTVDRAKDGIVDALEAVEQFARSIYRLGAFRLIGRLAIGIAGLLILTVVAVQLHHHFTH